MFHRLSPQAIQPREALEQGGERMGEIAIKSGNLIESYVTANERSRYVTVLYAELDLKPNTTYTISLILNEEYDVYFNEKCFSNWSAFTGDGTRKVFVLTTRSDLVKNNNTYTSGKGWWILKNNKYQANFISVSDFQILEGTYTSETIPEYQPYFLNRPAHQYVNGEWIDIPTHHFISGRWQGELTSQSPLKFRADGEMLDWRVEGRTSGNGGVGDWDETAQKYRIPVQIEGENLFNSETATPIYLDERGIEHPSEKSLTSDYISVKANTRYTLGETGDTDSINDAAYCFYNSNKEFISSKTYTQSVNGNIIRLLTPNDRSLRSTPTINSWTVTVLTSQQQKQQYLSQRVTTP